MILRQQEVSYYTGHSLNIEDLKAQPTVTDTHPPIRLYLLQQSTPPNTATHFGGHFLPNYHIHIMVCIWNTSQKLLCGRHTGMQHVTQGEFLGIGRDPPSSRLTTGGFKSSWEMVEILGGWAWLQEAGHWGTSPWRIYFVPSLLNHHEMRISSSRKAPWCFASKEA